MTYSKNLGVFSCLKRVFFLLMFVTLWQSESKAQCKARFEGGGNFTGGVYYGFKDSSYAAHGYKPIFSFGDGDSSKTAMGGYVYHRYPYMHKDTSYTMCLHIQDTISGCTSDTCITIKVTATPCYAKFYAYHYGKRIMIADESETGASVTIDYDFGDGSTLLNTSWGNPDHTYGKNGKYLVKIKVYNSYTNCVATYQDTVNVQDSIMVCRSNFSYNTYKSTTYFNNNSVTGNKYTSEWDFGDGSSKNYNASPSHLFSQSHSGKDTTYHVCLTVKDVSGYCSNTSCQDVIIAGSASCNADFKDSILQGTNGINVFFKPFSKSWPSAYSLNWDFGDGYTSANTGNVNHYYSIAHKYSYDTTFHVCLTMIDTKNNCQYTACRSIMVHYSTCLTSFTFTVDSNIVKFVNNSSTNNTDKKSFISKWYFGDGDSSTSTNPSHTYKDIKKRYQVCLIIKDTVHKCTSSYCSTISMLHSLGGWIDFGPFNKDSSKLCYKGHVWLIHFNISDSSLRALKDTALQIDSFNATYRFDSLLSGKYYVKVALDSGAKYYNKYIPTYYWQSFIWDTAYAIVLNGFNRTNTWIRMQKGVNPGGPGFIGGKISAGANKVGDPLKNIEVILLSPTGNPVQYTYSDAKGVYSFKNLAYGTYKVWAEVLGRKTTPNWVTIGPDLPSIDYINISVSSTQVRGTSGVVQTITADQNIIIYPNPVDNELKIEINAIKGGRTGISVYDIQGRVVMQDVIATAPGPQVKGVNTSNLCTGLYLLKVQMEDGNVKQFPFVKR